MTSLSLLAKLAISVSILAILVLSACGAVQKEADEKNQLTARLTKELTVNRGFTNVEFEEVETATFENSAKALVSVGGCRLNLEWRQKESWKLHDDSAVDGLTGELTAEQIRNHPKYQGCAKQPAPVSSGEPATPKSSS